jgi:c-di-GMP-binding flagellar brake protein YcgR
MVVILQAGSRIEVEIDSDRARGHMYASRVVQRARGHVFIAHPSEGGRYLPVRAGTRVVIGVAHEDEWVSLQAEVVQSFLLEDARSVLELTWPQQISAIPLVYRSGRFNVDLPLECSLVGEASGEAFEARATDISRVGLGAESPLPVEPGTQAPVVIGVVRRAMVKGMTKPRLWVLGVEFDPASTDWFARSGEYLARGEATPSAPSAAPAPVWE